MTPEYAIAFGPFHLETRHDCHPRLVSAWPLLSQSPRWRSDVPRREAARPTCGRGRVDSSPARPLELHRPFHEPLFYLQDLRRRLR